MTRLPLEVFVIVRRGDEYLVAHRTPSGGGYWHGIAGAVEHGETFAEAAKRELEEETGLLAQPAEIAEPYVYPVDGGDGVTVHSFLVDAPDGWEPRLNEEHDDYRWCSRDEALDLLRWPDSKEALRTL